MRTGTEPNMGKQEGNTGRRQNMSPTDCDTDCVGREIFKVSG